MRSTIIKELSMRNSIVNMLSMRNSVLRQKRFLTRFPLKDFADRDILLNDHKLYRLIER